MVIVHCTKSTHVIGQNQSYVVLLRGNNESFECSIDNITHRKRALFIQGLQILNKAINEDKINQIYDEASSKTMKRQTKRSFPILTCARFRASSELRSCTKSVRDHQVRVLFTNNALTKRKVSNPISKIFFTSSLAMISIT